MAEKRVSVRLAAEGGQKLRAELKALGREGWEALQAIQDGATPASAGLQTVESSTGAAVVSLDNLAARAARVAAQMRAAGAASQSMAARIDQATGVSRGMARSAEDMKAYGRALDDTRAKWNPMFSVIRNYRSQLAEIRRAHAVGAISADEMAAAISRERQASLASISAIKGRATALTAMSGASRMAAFRTQQMAFQLNDIGVSLASGMNPLMVMVQQGTQIGQIYGFGQGGVGQALRDVGGMIRGIVARMPLLTAGVAAAAVVIGGMTSEINATTDATVTMGDTAVAIFQVISDRISRVLRPLIEKIGPWFAAAWDVVVDATKLVGNAIINVMTATFTAIQVIGAGAFEALPKMAEGVIPGISAVWETLEAGFYTMLEGITRRWADFLHTIGRGLEGVPGLEEVRIAVGGAAISAGSSVYALGAEADAAAARAAGLRGQAGAAFGAGASSVEDAVEEAGRRIREIVAEDPLGEFFSDVRARAIERALGRVEEAAAGAAGKTKEADDAAKEFGRSIAVAADMGTRAYEDIREGLAGYAREAMDLGGNVSERLVQGFRSASNAVGEFVRTGKLNIRDMVTSMIADFARISAQRFIFGPLANAMNGAIGGLFGTAPLTSPMPVPRPSMEGGGHTGYGARAGGLDGRGGFLAMLHPRERIIDETRAGGAMERPVVVNFQVRDAESVRRSRVQVAADVQRAMAMGRRGV